MNNQYTSFLSVFTLMLLCISGDVLAVEPSTLEQRAKFTLGLDKSDFSISDTQKSGFRTDFVVTTKFNEIYRCYVTSAASIVSDAVCSQRKQNSDNIPVCNELLEAAGKC